MQKTISDEKCYLDRRTPPNRIAQIISVSELQPHARASG